MLPNLEQEYLKRNNGKSYIEFFKEYSKDFGWEVVIISSEFWAEATTYCEANFKNDEWQSFFNSFSFKYEKDATLFKLVWG
jgi:hypothetical protein